ncbi:ribokinase [Vibrio viridaestus]|uniref:Ribokinase n=1 Tax=Vibrio viridaestus TaxID=2487322 RepID=A0A3N9TKZ2_9VIBR|nr:ribokinase [Vibrio viridaestus]RQW64947.1 ribokinase [Vibrio viridaestus]
MNKLVVLGSVNADHVLQVPQFPRPGETLVGHNYTVIPGGKGANQAVAAARMGAETAFIAAVGDDAFGQNIRKDFENDGIDISAVKMQNACPTGIAMIQVSADGENTICLSPEANEKLNANLVEQSFDLIVQADYLLMQLETPLEGVLCAAKIAHESKTQVILNPAPAASLPDELLALIDIITPNETEAQTLTGIEVSDEKSAQAAANALHQKGINMVLITLGAKGVWLSVNSEQKVIPGFKVNAVDTTAAGDTFNGAFVTGLIEGKSLDDSIRFAHAAAALSVTKAGAQTSIPLRSEVDSFLSNNA